MKIVTLFVSSYALLKVSLTTFLASPANSGYWNSPNAMERGTEHILGKLSLQFLQLITANPITASKSLYKAVVGQQNNLTPAGQLFNYALAGSHIIRLSNGRTP